MGKQIQIYSSDEITEPKVIETECAINIYIPVEMGPQGPKGDKGDPGESGGCKYIYLGQWNGNNIYPLKFQNSCSVYVSLGEKMYENLTDNNKGNNPNACPTKWKLIFG